MTVYYLSSTLGGMRYQVGVEAVERYTNGQIVVWAEQVGDRWAVVCPDGELICLRDLPMEKVGRGSPSVTPCVSHFSLDRDAVAVVD